MNVVNPNINTDIKIICENVEYNDFMTHMLPKQSILYTQTYRNYVNEVINYWT